LFRAHLPDASPLPYVTRSTGASRRAPCGRRARGRAIPAVPRRGTSLAVGVAGPDRVAAGRVDDEVAVVLRGEVRAAVPVRSARPERVVVDVVEDEVAVRLHDRVVPVLAVRPRRPEGALAVVVEDEVAVGLHRERVAPVARREL